MVNSSESKSLTSAAARVGEQGEEHDRQRAEPEADVWRLRPRQDVEHAGAGGLDVRPPLAADVGETVGPCGVPPVSR